MRISLIGSGNVATHLGAALKNAGHHIAQVYSPNLQNAALLAYHVKAEPVDNIDQISPQADIFIIAAKDDAIPGIAGSLARHQVLTVHTSGATDMNTLQQYVENCGVLYPLQTFSKTREVDFRQVPLCLEASSYEVYLIIRELAQTVSNNIYQVDSQQRRVLHLAAVFACNFPNLLYNMAQQILAGNGLDFNIVRPLILETAQKVQELLPSQAQTGPAIRRDEQTMAAHLALLAQQPGLQELYKILSQEIIKMDIGQRQAD